MWAQSSEREAENPYSHFYKKASGKTKEQESGSFPCPNHSGSVFIISVNWCSKDFVWEKGEVEGFFDEGTPVTHHRIPCVAFLQVTIRSQAFKESAGTIVGSSCQLKHWASQIDYNKILKSK